jgi:hypothetical protein
MAMEVCRSELWQPGKYDPCGSLIIGTIDGLSFSGAVCLPFDSNNRQLAQIVFNYLRDNPERWNRPFIELVHERLLALYPCRKK